MPHTPWHRLARKIIYNSKFLEVYLDKVQLPNGQVIDDYSVVKKPSAVVIVATNSRNLVLT